MQPNWRNTVDGGLSLGVMRRLVEDKFLRDDSLAELLLSTGDGYLEETNTWGDVFFGVYNHVGQNHLGKILMTVRGQVLGGTGIVSDPSQVFWA